MILYEEQLLTLLGYYAVGPDHSNRWIIFNQDHEQIGFIQQKKLRSKNKKKDLPAIYGYYMEIESETISYKGSRKLEDDSNLFYQLGIKRDEKLVNHVELNLGSDTPGIFIWSKENGYMELKFLYDGSFFVDFKTKGERSNIRQQVILKSINQNKDFDINYNHYHYSLSFCDKEKDINRNHDVTILNVTFDCDSIADKDGNSMKITTENWDRGKLIKFDQVVTKATLEEAITKLSMGIDVVSNFRNFVNQVLPFEQDVISHILKQKGGDYPMLMLFLPDNDQKSKIKVI